MREYGREEFKKLTLEVLERLMKEHPHKVCFAYYSRTGNLAFIPGSINYPDCTCENYITIYVPPKVRISVIDKEFKDILEELKKLDNLELEIHVWHLTKVDETRYLVELYGKQLLIETPPNLLPSRPTGKTFHIGEDGYPKYDGKRVRFIEASRKELLALLL